MKLKKEGKGNETGLIVDLYNLEDNIKLHLIESLHMTKLTGSSSPLNTLDAISHAMREGLAVGVYMATIALNNKMKDKENALVIAQQQ